LNVAGVSLLSCQGQLASIAGLHLTL